MSNFDKRRAYAIKTLLLGGEIPTEVNNTQSISMTQLEGLEMEVVGETMPEGDISQVTNMSQASCPDLQTVINSTTEN